MGTLEADPTEREVVCVREREKKTRTEREREVGEEGEREAERRAEKERASKEQSGGQEARESKMKDCHSPPCSSSRGPGPLKGSRW